MIHALIITALISGTPYVSGEVGAGCLKSHELHFAQHEYKCGPVLAGSLGYTFTKFFSIEGQIMHTENDREYETPNGSAVKQASSGSVTRTFYFINGIFDIPIYKNLEAFAGGGYGFPRYQFFGGLKYNMTSHWSIGVKYAYVTEPYDARTYTIHPTLGDICGGQPNGVCSGPEKVYRNEAITLVFTYNFWGK